MEDPAVVPKEKPHPGSFQVFQGPDQVARGVPRGSGPADLEEGNQGFPAGLSAKGLQAGGDPAGGNGKVSGRAVEREEGREEIQALFVFQAHANVTHPYAGPDFSPPGPADLEERFGVPPSGSPPAEPASAEAPDVVEEKDVYGGAGPEDLLPPGGPPEDGVLVGETKFVVVRGDGPVLPDRVMDFRLPGPEGPGAVHGGHEDPRPPEPGGQVIQGLQVGPGPVEGDPGEIEDHKIDPAGLHEGQDLLFGDLLAHRGGEEGAAPVGTGGIHPCSARGPGPGGRQARKEAGQEKDPLELHGTPRKEVMDAPLS